MTCPKCKYQNLHGTNFCEKCGLDLKAAARAAANPVPTPVQPYGYSGSYGSSPSSSYGSGSGGYSPPPRPTAAPRPIPAGRGTPQPPGPPPPSVAQPRPAEPAAQRPAPPRPAPSRPVAAPIAPAPEPPRRREPLPFGRLVMSNGQEFPLRYDDNLVGRASPGEGINPAVDLSVADTSGSVSRRHARIGKDDSTVYVEDLGSSNGSRHNGQPLRVGMQTSLNDGDELVFGSLQFRYHKI